MTKAVRPDKARHLRDAERAAKIVLKRARPAAGGRWLVLIGDAAESPDDVLEFLREMGLDAEGDEAPSSAAPRPRTH